MKYSITYIVPYEVADGYSKLKKFTFDAKSDKEALIKVWQRHCCSDDDITLEVVKAMTIEELCHEIDWNQWECQIYLLINMNTSKILIDETEVYEGANDEYPDFE